MQKYAIFKLSLFVYAVFSIASAMGIRLLILMGLLIGVLYCLHILAQDYQTITAPKLLRLLFKRDVNSTMSHKPTVRWKKILNYDPIQCARLLYCDFGAHLSDNELRRGFISMLSLQTHEEDVMALKEFTNAYFEGKALRSHPEHCKNKYFMCPFQAPMLFKLLRNLLNCSERCLTWQTAQITQNIKQLSKYTKPE